MKEKLRFALKLKHTLSNLLLSTPKYCLTFLSRYFKIIKDKFMDFDFEYQLNYCFKFLDS